MFGQDSRIRHLGWEKVAAVITAGQPDDAKGVSEGAIEIHVRVIVNADGFVTIATALMRFFARGARLAAKCGT
jgi:hypothetical protein